MRSTIVALLKGGERLKEKSVARLLFFVVICSLVLSMVNHPLRHFRNETVSYEENFFVGQAEGSVVGSWIHINLDIDVRTKNEGKLQTYIGLSQKMGDGYSYNFDALRGNYSYKQLPRSPTDLYENILYTFGESERVYTKMVLGVDEPIEITKTTIKLYTTGIEFISDYSIMSSASEIIIRPLNFLYEQWIQVAINAIDLATFLYSGQNAFAVTVKLITAPSIALISSTLNLRHIRTPFGESSNYDIRYSAFISQSNDIRVVDGFFISPSGLFVILVLCMVVSIFLIIYCVKNRYDAHLFFITILFIMGFLSYIFVLPGTRYLVYLFLASWIALPIVGIMNGSDVHHLSPRQYQKKIKAPSRKNETANFQSQGTISVIKPESSIAPVNSKNCPNCSASFKDFRTMCDSCGKNISYCRECGFPKKEQDKFCRGCGKETSPCKTQ